MAGKTVLALAGKKKSWVILPFLFIWVVFATLAVTWGIRYDWPDYVHIDYGFPLVWATHTLSTIAGPADVWEVNVTMLLMDLLLWLGTMLIVVSVMLHFFSRENSRTEPNIRHSRKDFDVTLLFTEPL